MTALDVAPEVAALVPQEDLIILERQAATTFECLRCRQPGRLPETPAAVILRRDGDVMVANLAHRSCSRSRVLETPGLAQAVTSPAAGSEAIAIAAMLPAGEAGFFAPALLVELETTVSHRVPETGDRVDQVLSWALCHGLCLMPSMDVLSEPVPGWAVEIRGERGLRVESPGDPLYDGELTVIDAWRNAVAQLGACYLLLGTGLHLREAPTPKDVLRRLDHAAEAGRLAAGLVVVRLS